MNANDANDLRTAYAALLTEADAIGHRADFNYNARSKVKAIVDQRLAKKYRYFTGCILDKNSEKAANYPESVPTPADWVQAGTEALAAIKRIKAMLG